MSAKKFGAGLSIIGALFGGGGDSVQQAARAERVQYKNSHAAVTREVNRNHSINKYAGKKGK